MCLPRPVTTTRFELLIEDRNLVINEVQMESNHLSRTSKCEMTTVPSYRRHSFRFVSVVIEKGRPLYDDQSNPKISSISSTTTDATFFD